MKHLTLFIAFLFSGMQIIAQAPVVSSFSPTSGLVGSTVTITGANFDGTDPANNQVFFGSAEATVLTSSFGTLTVSVPAASTTNLISVRNATTRLSGYSRNHFNGLFCDTPLDNTTYGTFSPTVNGDQEITGINGAYNIDIYDMDGDGKSDIITARNTGGITIAHNQSTPGQMNFSAFNINTGNKLFPVNWWQQLLPIYVQQFFIADFDGDGKRDIVGSGDRGVFVFRNLSTPGNLQFSARIDVTGTQRGFYQCAAGDLDGDGRIDIVAETGNRIYTYRNISTGPGNISFTGNSNIAVGSRCNGIQCVDADGDGKTDIIASQRSVDRIIALQNTTTASSFTFAALQTFSTVERGPYRLKMGDFDKDGKIDMVMPLYEGAKTCIFRNSSSPGSINFDTPIRLTASANNYRVGVGDVNGDGFPDIVTKPNGIGAIFQVYKNVSPGPGTLSFDPAVTYYTAAGSEVGGIAIGDMDGDLVPDIATSGITSNKIRFHRNTSSAADTDPPTAACKDIVVALDPTGNVVVTGEMIDDGSGDACGLQPLLIDGVASVNFTCSDIGSSVSVLRVTDLAGNTAECNATITIAPAAIIVAGQTTVCQGETITMTANVGDSYQWYKDGVAISGATSQQYIVTETGSYTVQVINVGGCSGVSDPLVATVNENPTVNITPAELAYLCQPSNTAVLTASASSIYQWYKDGVLISGATNQSYTATSTGDYTVEVIDLFGCSAVSDPVTVLPELVCTGPSDLNFWSQKGDPASGNWSVNPGGEAVYQSINGFPTFYVSPETFFNTTIEGTFEVGNDGDDDFIGFVIGYEEPSTLTSFPLVGKFIVFDWKRNNQYLNTTAGTALSGYYLAEVDGTFTSGSDMLYALWDHVDTRVNQLDAPTGGGWAYNTEYTFSIDYSATNITIRIDGNEIYNVNGTFSPGKFGFYNNSQSQVTYSGFTQEFTVGIDGTDETCSGDNNGSATANPSSFGVAPFTYNWSNGGTTQTITNLAPGTYCVTVSDSKGCEGCSAEACFEIGTVLDEPDAKCKDITVSFNGESDVTIEVDNIDNGSTADCGIASISVSPNQFFCADYVGSDVTVSQETVTLTIEDINGNTDVCNAIVTIINDDNPPVFDCPVSITVNNEVGQCFKNVVYNVDATDNCSNVTIIQTEGLSSGSDFPVGLTTNTFEANDVDNNVSTCSFTVSVIDAEAPIAKCKDITVELDASGPGTLSDVNISGIVNAYAEVTSVLSDQVVVTSPSGFAIGNKVLIIQMAGAEIELSNTSNFGDILNPNNAGNYEYARISNITGNNISLLTNLERNYDANSKVQLVKIPEYDNVIVSGTLSAADWNGSTGGVLAFDAQGTVTFNAGINMNGKGYRGGLRSNNFYNATCFGYNNSYSMNAPNGNAANKGEGMILLSASISAGKGKAANAGGGGGSVNAGGGGGSNYGAGGDGGQWSGCSINEGGLGGEDLSALYNNNKIFMGGGGGGGQQNNSASTNGADGGGIVLISADQINGNGYSISAKGNNALNAGGDGSGAGGAGGSIFLNVNTINTTLNLAVDGGNGGAVSPDHGVGGGGGGGLIWHSGSSLPNNLLYSVNGGLKSNTDGFGAKNGSNGGVMSSLQFPGVTTISVATILLTDVDDGSSDNCDISSIELSKTEFDCDDVGSNPVTLTIADVNGLSTSCDATVTVEDVDDPVWNNEPINKTVECDGTYGASGQFEAWLESFDGSDNCGNADVSHNSIGLSGGCGETGSETVEFTLTDDSGNQITKSATFTIVDMMDPTWTVAPSDMVSVACDPATNATAYASWLTSFSGSDVCSSATVTNNNPGLSDLCGGTGSATVTFTLTDECGNDITKDATFTIVDTTDPTWDVAPSDMVSVACDLATNGAAYASWLTSFSGSDVCGGATVTNNNPGLSDLCGGTGSATVTFTLTDECGNNVTKDATFTIVDTTDPTWDVAPSDMVSVECDPATNGAAYASWLTSFSGSDVCGSATVTNNNPGLSDLCGGTGSATVTFTLTDDCGNNITKDATFTIVDTAPPSITCPTNIQTCADQDQVSGAGAEVSWTEPPMPTDACGSASAVSDYVNGGVYSVGITTVTYTATDECGRQTQCDFDIEVWELPEVSISESELPIYCQENSKILSASVVSNTGGITYSWDTGSTTDTIHVVASGVYNVEVTDANGCTRAASYNVTVIPQNLLSAYTIIAEDDVHLHGNNVVLNGGVGVLDDKGKAKIHDESFVSGATTFVQSDKIEINNDSGVDTEILSPSTVSLPPFYANLFDSDNDVTVAKNSMVTLSDQVYDKIDVKEGSTVIFTQTDLYIGDLKTKEDVILKFPSCAFVRVEKNLDFYKNVTVNPDGHQVQFYVDSNVEVKEGSTVNASIDARGHNINVKGKDDNPTFMNGQFIGKKIHGDKYVTWDWSTACDPGCEPGPDPVLITCECHGGLSSVTVDYSGGAGASLTTNDGTITDNGDGTYTIFDGGDKLKRNLEVDDGTNTGSMHTSCSQDILGQTFGGVFTVVAHIDMNNETSTVADCPDGVDRLVVNVNTNAYADLNTSEDSEAVINTEQSKNITEAKVYPNPTTGRITFDLTVDTNATERLLIYNSQGQIIVDRNINLVSGFNSNKIDLSDYHSGLYFIRLGDLPIKRILVIQ